jgi:hypothetical protein
MGIDQTRDQELALRFDRCGAGRRLDRALGRPDRADIPPSRTTVRDESIFPPASSRTEQPEITAGRGRSSEFARGSGARTARAINADHDDRFMSVRGL